MRTYFWRANPLAAPILAAADGVAHPDEVVGLPGLPILGLSHLAQPTTWALPAGMAEDGPVSDPSESGRGVMIRALRPVGLRVVRFIVRVFDANWMQIEEYLRRDHRVVLPTGSTE